MAKYSDNPRRRRLFMVRLKIDMPNTPEFTFFGSKKAIFEYFGNGTIGLSYSTSRTIDFKETPYENAKCQIVEGELFTLSSKELAERREREGRREIRRETRDLEEVFNKKG